MPETSLRKEPTVGEITRETNNLPLPKALKRFEELRQLALQAHGVADNPSDFLTNADIARDRYLRFKEAIAMAELGDVLEDMADGTTEVSTAMGDVTKRKMNAKEKLDLQKRRKIATETLDVIHGVPSRPVAMSGAEGSGAKTIQMTVIQAPEGAYSPTRKALPEPPEDDTTEGEVIPDDDTDS